jgi:hypothetical protein
MPADFALARLAQMKREFGRMEGCSLYGNAQKVQKKIKSSMEFGAVIMILLII